MRRDPAIILIAHPTAGVRTLCIENILFFTNYRVVEAEGELTEKVRRHRPTVAILPAPSEVGGWDAIEALTRDPLTRDVRLVGLTDAPTVGDQRRADELGMQLVALPRVPTMLIEIIKRMVSSVVTSPRSPMPLARTNGQPVGEATLDAVRAVHAAGEEPNG